MKAAHVVFVALAAALAVVVLSAGCEAKNITAPLRPEGAPYLEQGRVQFEDRWTADHVKVVQDPTTDRVGAGLLKVTLTLRNTTKDNLWCDVRTTFLDNRGHVLEQTNWEPVLLDFRTVSEYTCTSMGAQAADYQIIIRKPNKSSLNLP